VRANSLSRLANIGSAAKPVADKVAAAMSDPEMEVRLAAARCYFVLTGDTRRTIPVLLGGIREPPGRSAHWCEAARTLGEIGPPAKAAVPLLIEMLEGKRESTKAAPVYIGPPTPWFHVRTYAAIALGRIGPEAKTAIPALIKSSKQADDGLQTAGPLRVRSARALWRIDPNHAESVLAVLRGTKERYPLNRIAIDSIIMIGPPAKAAVPDLIRALDDDHGDVQLAAIDALGMIGAPAESAVPALQTLTASMDSRLVEHAKLAIERIGPPEGPVEEILKVVQKSGLDDERRQFFAEWLEKLKSP
jgi:HEAT repeat protein